MKNILTLLCILMPLLMSGQQTTETAFNFEGGGIPSQWKALNGSLSLSDTHYKEGTHSLCWHTEGLSTLELDLKPQNYKGKCTYLQLRSGEITYDTLQVTFLNANNELVRSARALINFKGWTEFNRAYNEYTQTNDPVISKVRFTLLPSNRSAKRMLWFDAVDFASAPVPKYKGTLFLPDQPGLATAILTPTDNTLTIPTPQERAGLDSLRNRLPRKLLSTTDIATARSYTDAWQIVRNADGSVRGNPMDCRRQALNAKWMQQLFGVLQQLAIRSKIPSVNKTPDDRQDSIRFVNLLDFALDQGISQGVNYGFPSSEYGTVRTVPPAILNVASAVTADRRAELLKLVAWITSYSSIYPGGNTDTDKIYNYLPVYYGYALLQENDAVAVRELKALKAYLERTTQTPGRSDGFKPDGSGFHHGAHYNNYMYALKSWVKFMAFLQGTAFTMSAEKYTQLRRAVAGLYLQYTRAADGTTFHCANSLAGRNCYGGGIKMPLPLSAVDSLVYLGGSILGTGIDSTLAALYNYMTFSHHFDVKPLSFDGYYPYNYSPMAIVRKNNWVVTMRTPVSNLWGSEIYWGQNRFGRYQSHGSMEVSYSGALGRSGIPLTPGAGGWDWNCVPGTTTVHYTRWTDMTPGRNVQSRFDQYAKDTNFSGALALDNCGVYAADFIQNDWGTTFEATNLKFRKSVFTCDSVFVALGSGISAVRDKLTSLVTATNLFQEVKSDYSQQLIVDGKILAKGDSALLNVQTGTHWLLSPLGTGYIIPRQKDNLLVIRNGMQRSPKENGSDMLNPQTSVEASKGYISHGTQPSNGHYEFVMIPATNAKAVARLASDSYRNRIYRVMVQSNKVHAVNFPKAGLTAYAFFEPVNDKHLAPVRSTTAPHLLMLKQKGRNQLELSVADPDLHLKDNKSQPSSTTITLQGSWRIRTKSAGVQNLNRHNGLTSITVMMTDGLPEHLTIEKL